MSLTEGSDLKLEREQLEEFRFLFDGLQHASAVHPPQEVLDEYVRGVRPKGIDSQLWQSQAVSAHVGGCDSCRLHVQKLRRKQWITQLRHTSIDAWKGFWRDAARSRRAYQYLGILVLIIGLLTVYSFMRNPQTDDRNEPHPTPITTDFPPVYAGGGG